MTDVYVYADETGTLDFDEVSASRYFGLGTASFRGDHAEQLWAGFRLRCSLGAAGVRLPKGLHAKNDNGRTRSEVFAEIAKQAPQFDATFLLKANAYQRVKARGRVYLYKYAFYVHCKEVVRRVSRPGDTVCLIVGNLQTSNKRDAIRHAVEDVCSQIGRDRHIVPCIWEAPSSWGIQVADYGLWACQRVLERRACPWYETSVKPSLRSLFLPWGRAA